MSGKPTFDSVARKIGGDYKLAKALEQLANNVETEIHNAKFDLKRSEVRADLKRLRNESRRFEVALSRAWKHALDFPSNADEFWSSARAAIDNINSFSDHILNSLDPKGGRPEAPGRVTCATIVIQAWAMVHGKPPGPNNAKAQEACDGYWRACGGSREGDLSKWRRQISIARTQSSQSVPDFQGTKSPRSFS
jgi:hypothetical protein